MYTYLKDTDWVDKFYTSPNCSNKMCVWLFETPHGCWDEIWSSLILIDWICRSVDWQAVISVEYLYLMLIQCSALWLMVDYFSMLLYMCCMKIHIINFIWYLIGPHSNLKNKEYYKIKVHVLTVLIHWDWSCVERNILVIKFAPLSI